MSKQKKQNTDKRTDEKNDQLKQYKPSQDDRSKRDEDKNNYKI